MNLIIPFTPTEEVQISAAARQTGLTPAELIKRLVLENLPTVAVSVEDEVNAKLRQWQEQDGTPLMPDISTQELFAQWAEEDAKMTDEERDAEDRLWEDIERALLGNDRALQLRRSGE